MTLRENTAKTINQKRDKYIRIGFIKVTGIMDFFGVSYGTARDIYNEVKEKIESEEVVINGEKRKKKVSPLGIRTVKLLEYFELSEKEIVRYADRERLEKERNLQKTIIKGNKKTDAATSATT